MANPEHVALVRKGAQAIAEWRQTYPRERFDLSAADLHGASLGGADLHGANLVAANVIAVNLAGANLAGANLNLANLVGTNLSQVNLSGAFLLYAAVGQANLGKAHVSGAKLGHTSLTDLDLSGVMGLTSVEHLSSSSIGVDTLIASFRGAGNRLTPDLRTFFLGAGVPRELLDVLRQVVSEIMYYSCFISYGQPDVKFAKNLCEELEGHSVPCWLYEMDKTVGKPTRREIGESRRGADRFVVLCSAAALVRVPVLEEIEDQINEDPERLVPISLDNLWKEPGFKVIRGNHNLKPDLENRNYADFANKPYQEALDELLRGLRRPDIQQPGDST